MAHDPQPPSRQQPAGHQRGAEKLARIPVTVETSTDSPLRKPAWIRVRAPVAPGVTRVRRLLRAHGLSSVCEEAACPNLGECFGQGIATFLIMGDLCTRRCPFCDVAHGRPQPLNAQEPRELASAVQALQLRYVVITSVDRDDLRDGGAEHFAQCVQALRGCCPELRIELLVPDFRGRLDVALAALAAGVPDVLNHNLETVPRLYAQVRPGADYRHSLTVLRAYKQRHPEVPTKSGLMLGLGEEPAEVGRVLEDLREQGCEMLTIGQYLQPSTAHHPVLRYAPPEEFAEWAARAKELGFTQVASAPLVRSSYHADQQAAALLAKASAVG